MTKPLVLALGIAVALLGAGRPACATAAQQAESQRLYRAGEVQFRAGHFAEAHAQFKAAYLLYPVPELLFNMASALQGAGRPRESADALRAFLRVRPDAPERVELEARIRALDEAQRLLDADRLLHAPLPSLVSVPAGGAVQPGAARRRTLIAIVSSVSGVVVAVGLGVGLGLGLRDPHTSSALGTHTVTP